MDSSNLHEFVSVHDINVGRNNNQLPFKPSPSDSNKSIFCRICHEGDGSEALVAPCKCTGTVALIHTSCLEHWLTASNSDRCEICKNVYQIVKEPRSCMEYLQDNENQWNVRNLIADIICFFLLTPLLIVSTYLCALGANQYFMREKWEAIGLVILSLFLLAVYLTWCHVTTRFHISTWQSWRTTNQQIRLVSVPCSSRGDPRRLRSSRRCADNPRASSVVLVGGRGQQQNALTPLQTRMSAIISTPGTATFRSIGDSLSQTQAPNNRPNVYNIDIEAPSHVPFSCDFQHFSTLMDDGEDEEIILDESDTSRIIVV